MASLIERMLKTSTIKQSALLSNSKVYGTKECIQTDVPMINVALSGSLDGGLLPGLLTLAGPSKHFKSGFALLMMAAFHRKYKDGIILFYDSEFGTPPSYFSTFGVDMDRVVHTPIVNIEELKFDVTKQLGEFTKSDKIMIVVDSVGNLASLKEAEDALDGKSVADMSRAKQLKSVFRIITPHLHLKDIPMVVINHTYKSMEMYSRDIVSGGTGLYYSSDQVWILGRQQEKDGKDVSGYNFIINIEKSRHVKEKSKIPVNVMYKGGINRNSGLFELALETGYLVKPKMGWYNEVNIETGEVSDKAYREKDFYKSDNDFFARLVADKKFKEFVENRFRLVNDNSGEFDDLEEEIVEDEE